MARARCSTASSTAAATRSGSSLRLAADSTIRSPPRSCSVASCSSRAQRRRSASDACSVRRSVSSAALWAVATAVAALAAKPNIRRSSSAVNSGPSSRRSNAARMPSARSRKRSGTISPDAASTWSARNERIRPRKSASRSGLPVRRTWPPTESWSGKRKPTTEAGTSPATVVDDELVALGERQHHAAGARQGAAALDDELVDPAELGLTAQRASDLDRRLEPADGTLELVAARPHVAVMTRVAHGDGRPAGEHDGGLLVLLVEGPPCFSVRYRLPQASPSMRTGTPRKLRIGGWPTGNP